MRSSKLLFVIFLLGSSLFAQEEHLDLDSINKVITDWNDAINHKDYDDLSAIYGTSISYYLNKKSNQEVLSSKKKALTAHPDYNQSIKDISIEYPSNNPSIVRCVFKKIWEQNGQESGTRAIIELDKNDSYKIIKESDVPTELKRFNQTPAIPFEKQKYKFEMQFWQDTRESEVIAHDFIAYYMLLDVDLTETEPSVGLSWYSGAFRVTTDFIVRNASVDGGVLKIVAAPLMFDEDDPDEDAFQHFTFKRVAGGVVLLENDGWFNDALPLELSDFKK